MKKCFLCSFLYLLFSVNLFYYFYLYSVQLLKKIAEVDGGKYEAAVYAAQCGNLKRVLSICTDWEVCLSE